MFQRAKAPVCCIVGLLAVAALFPANVRAAEGREQPERPNLVIVLADDCTYFDLGTYGGQAFTPNLDRLASEGMKMTRCFQAAPMCSPTRHNLYTGIYPVRSGAYPNHTFAREGTQSIVHYLEPLGYRVALSGKRHIAPQSVFPFEYSGRENNPDLEAIDRLFRECRSSGQPFCLFACSNEPHSPWNRGDASRYPPETLELPPFLYDTPVLRSYFSRYLAEVTYFDDQIGQILELLDAHELADNTLVMVLSEQGNSFPFAKWTLYDAGIQSAMVVRWPGHVREGTSSEALVEYVDVCPTLVEAAGGEPVAGLDGRSFLNVLQGESDRHKDYVFGIMTTTGIINAGDPYPIRSVRSDRFKLIRNLAPDHVFRNTIVNHEFFQSWLEAAEAGDGRARERARRYQVRPAVELYDLAEDPFEMHNLAGEPEYAPIVERLSMQLDRWMTAQGDEGLETEVAAPTRQRRARRNRDREADR